MTESKPCTRPTDVPDRVCIESGSKYYFPHYKLLGVRTDETELHTVVEFDVANGWLRLQVNGPNGKPKKERGKWVTIRKNIRFDVYWRGDPVARPCLPTSGTVPLEQLRRKLALENEYLYGVPYRHAIEISVMNALIAASTPEPKTGRLNDIVSAPFATIGDDPKIPVDCADIEARCLAHGIAVEVIHNGLAFSTVTNAAASGNAELSSKKKIKPFETDIRKLHARGIDLCPTCCGDTSRECTCRTCEGIGYIQHVPE